MKRGLLLTMLLLLAGCTVTPSEPPTPVGSSASPGPDVHGHVLVFNPADHDVEQSGPASEATITDDAVAAGLSPNRRTLAYVTQHSQLKLRDLATGTDKQIDIRAGTTPLTAGKCVRWSPDGKRLALLSQDGGLYVSTPAGAAVKIDVPKLERYAQTDGHIFDTPDANAPVYNISSTVTCGRWLDANRLVFDRVAEMPSAVTIENGLPQDVAPDTTTVATVNPVRLTDTPKQWELRDICGAYIISSVRSGDTTTNYTVSAKSLNDVAPAAGKLPHWPSMFVPGSCDVLVLSDCAAGKCAPSRITPGTGHSESLPPLRMPGGSTPALKAGSVAWNPAGTQFAADSDGYIYAYDLATGGHALALTGDLVGGHGDETEVLGWTAD